MTERVLNGLTKALRAQFPTAGIYTQDVTQGLKPADLRVWLESVTMEAVPGNMRRWELRFVVCCYMPEGHPQLGILEQLYCAVPWVTLDSGLRLKVVGERVQLKKDTATMGLRIGFYALPNKAEPMEVLDYAASV